MAEPITWKNIGRYDPAEAARPMAYGAQTINQGFDQLQRVLSGITSNDDANWQNQKVNNTQAFLNQLAGYKTPEELQAAQAAGTLADMRAGFGAQVDQAAIRGAEENRIGQLRTALTQEQKFGEDQNILAHKPLMDAASVAYMKGDTAAGDQIAANFPAIAPQLAELKRTILRQNTQESRDTTLFNQKVELFPLEKQAKQGEINAQGLNAQANKTRAETDQLQARAAQAQLEAATAKTRSEQFDKQFKAAIETKEEQFKDTNVFGEGSVTQDRNVDKLNDFITKNVKNESDANKLRQVLLKPRATEVKDPVTGEMKKMEGIPLALAKRLVLQSVSENSVNLDGTWFSDRGGRLSESLDKALKDPKIAQDYLQAMEMERNRADGYGKLKSSLYSSLGINKPSEAGTAGGGTGGAAYLNDPANRPAVMADMNKIAANRPAPIPWSPGQRDLANSQASAVKNEQLKNMQINTLVQDWLNTDDPALKRQYAKEIKAAGGEVPGK